MPVASRSRSVRGTWHALSPEQRVAGIAAILLVVSTFGPFSFVEAAIVLVAGAILLLLKKRAEGRAFHLPFGDGSVIAVAGLWCAVLILVRVFDRPLGQNLLALACAAILLGAGVRERARQPLDDLPRERAGVRRRQAGRPAAAPDRSTAPERKTERLDETVTRPLADDAATPPLADDERG